MLIDVLKTGSDGNGFVIKTASEYLLIECGVKASEMLKSVKYEVCKIVGCLVSHEHSLQTTADI